MNVFDITSETKRFSSMGDKFFIVTDRVTVVGEFMEEKETTIITVLGSKFVVFNKTFKALTDEDIVNIRKNLVRFMNTDTIDFTIDAIRTFIETNKRKAKINPINRLIKILDPDVVADSLLENSVKTFKYDVNIDTDTASAYATILTSKLFERLGVKIERISVCQLEDHSLKFETSILRDLCAHLIKIKK